MAVEPAGGALPVAVVLDECLERAQELAAVLALGALDGIEQTVAEYARSASSSCSARSSVKAPRSRCEATSGASPLASDVASSAQRASWKARRSEPTDTGRRGRRASLAKGDDRASSRASRATSIGSRPTASTTAQSSGLPAAVVVATRAGAPAPARTASSAPSAAGGSSSSKTSTARLVTDAERAQPPLELLGVEAPAERLGEQVPGQPALGLAHHPLAHQLEPDDHRQPGGRSAARTRRAASPLAGNHDEPGDERAAPGHWNCQAAAASDGIAGAKGATGGCSATLGQLRCRAPRGPRRASRSRSWRGELAPGRVQDERSMPLDRGGDGVQPPRQAPALDHQALEAARAPRLARASTSYCSLASLVKARSVIAMNGCS